MSLGSDTAPSGPGAEGLGSLCPYLMMTHWFSQSMSMFRYMLSVRA